MWDNKVADSVFPQIRQAGEDSVLIYLAAIANPQVLAQVQWLTVKITQQLGSLLVEIVPSYHSILVVYDFLRLDRSQLDLFLADLLTQLPDVKDEVFSHGTTIELPCYYSVETGPDLLKVASLHQLSISEIIHIHSAQVYQVYAIGFAPGFAYLGWLDQRIATPRLTTPRTSVPAGSVAIADRQTAIYPATSPGGWHLLGNCPISLFDLDRSPQMPYGIGDTVRFVPIERAEYFKMGGH